ncbi:hypothetical protein PAPYR_10923 [Paratrimastix pyriformis]|uniref:Uncharacterized protein n=1 Tax=Paratrimastix pyriformis TaxID=342808 RepID=A0ABQ8U944_9EUKA|nr:hypothetical protein PAPYR_10923 [Paratrimastix pyriformis]
MGGFGFPQGKGPVQEVALFFRDAAKVPAHFPSPEARLPEFLSGFSMPVPFYFAYRAPISLLWQLVKNRMFPLRFARPPPVPCEPLVTNRVSPRSSALRHHYIV